MKYYFLILFTFTTFIGFSQDITKAPSKGKKGEFYMYWGWNWSWYSKSDIHFEGEGYDFELKSVAAQDRQSKFSLDKYLNPKNATIPQYNIRIGYFFNDHYSVSIGTDHMKYVVAQGQTVKINGYINGSGTEYDGVYNNDAIVIQEGFLEFEHTDGLNYANVDVRRFEELHYFSEKIQLNLFAGAGIGGLYPKTNTSLLSKNRYDEFHLSGYGLHALVGVNFTFFKYFFIQTEFKGGYINMPNIRTTQFKSDSAGQQFFFAQYNFNFGASYPLFDSKKKKEKQ